MLLFLHFITHTQFFSNVFFTIFSLELKLLHFLPFFFLTFAIAPPPLPLPLMPCIRSNYKMLYLTLISKEWLHHLHDKKNYYLGNYYYC